MAATQPNKTYSKAGKLTTKLEKVYRSITGFDWIKGHKRQILEVDELS